MSRFLASVCLFSCLSLPAISILELYYKHQDLFTVQRGIIGQQDALTLANKGITSLDGIEKIPVCAQIRFLHLQKNCLQSLPHGWLRSFPRLEGLYLSGNRLNDLAPEMFEGCPTIVELHLQQNALAEIPQGLLSQLTALRYLSLGRNSLSVIRSSDFSASPITILKLDGCPLQSVTLDAQLPELTDLYIKLPVHPQGYDDLLRQCPKLTRLSDGL